MTNFRIPRHLVKAAREKAGAEGRTLTDVVVAYLRRYVSTPPRNAPGKPNTGNDQSAG